MAKYFFICSCMKSSHYTCLFFILFFGLLCSAAALPASTLAATAPVEAIMGEDGPVTSTVSTKDNATEQSADDQNTFLGGTLIGAAFLGTPFTGLGALDIFFIGMCLSILLRNFRKKRAPKDGKEKNSLPNPFDPESFSLRKNKVRAQDLSPFGQDSESKESDKDAEEKNTPEAPKAGRAKVSSTEWNVRATWDALRTRPAGTNKESAASSSVGEVDNKKQTSSTGQVNLGRRGDPLSAYGRAASGIAEGAHVPSDFDVADFLEGARMLYVRLQNSWAERDVDDLEPFLTTNMMDLLCQQAKLLPDPQDIEILRVTATLIDVRRPDAMHEEVDVRFNSSIYFEAHEAHHEVSGVETKDVIIHASNVSNLEDRPRGPVEVEELWFFCRSSMDNGAWRLSGIGADIGTEVDAKD